MDDYPQNSLMPEAVLEQIVRSIAQVEGVNPMNLDLFLERHISTDAIQNLVNHESDSWRIQFETPNHVVEVTGNDAILVDGTLIDTYS